MRQVVRTIIAFTAALAAVLGLVACDTQRGAGGRCTSADEEVTRGLEDNAVLDLAPPGATVSERYAKMPCQDEDKTGEVGRQVSSSDGHESVLAFYRSEMPKHGWSLVRQREDEPGRVNGDGPNQCYENPSVPGVALVLSVGHGENPSTDSHLAFRFKADRGSGCADNYRS
ncbi:hypothetical protein [Saccharothrix hoggarensis]|uniref:Uncharacterized protein n=1 Tax=Saccharothrix hoggarensis TaxID=913853 RepID=A0ABW3QJ10_9PSEU